MTEKRVNELLKDYRAALARLKDALGAKASKGSLEIDGTIQRFEFTFELAWKLAKNTLEFQGIQAQTPRTVIKEAYKAGLVEDGDAWIDMMEDRNKTSHIYNEKQALVIYKKIKKHFAALKKFEKKVSASAV